MAAHIVECLHCGQQRLYQAGGPRGHDAGECIRCGYVGWAFAEDMDERLRRALRERPPGSRRFHSVSAA